jgi:peptide/nickel transport system permease protein
MAVEPRLPHLRAIRAVSGGLYRNDPIVKVAVGVLVVILLLAIVGPWIAPQDPRRVDLGAAFVSPGSEHLLGADASGRDILSRILAGARTSVLAPVVIAFIATLAGTVIAISSAWIGGWFDFATARVLDVLFAFPGLLLAILAVAVFGTGLTAPVIALSMSYMPYIARVIRSAAIRERNLPYIAACQTQGLGGLRICVRHLLPNVRLTVAVQAAVMFSYAMVDLAAVNFLGLGLEATKPDWGVMVASGQSSILRGHPEESLFASLMIVLTVVSVSVLTQRAGAASTVAEAR